MSRGFTEAELLAAEFSRNYNKSNTSHHHSYSHHNHLHNHHYSYGEDDIDRRKDRKERRRSESRDKDKHRSDRVGDRESSRRRYERDYDDGQYRQARDRTSRDRDLDRRDDSFDSHRNPRVPLYQEYTGNKDWEIDSSILLSNQNRYNYQHSASAASKNSHETTVIGRDAVVKSLEPIQRSSRSRSRDRNRDRSRDRSRSRSAERLKALKSNWKRDKFNAEDASKSPSPDRERRLQNYRPPSPTWISRAGGVAIMRKKSTTSAPSK